MSTDLGYFVKANIDIIVGESKELVDGGVFVTVDEAVTCKKEIMA